MKHIISYICVLFMCSCFAQEHLSSKVVPVPREWEKVNPKQVFADTEVKLSEKYSIRLENYIQIQKEFSLKPGIQYELTFFLKGKNITTNDKRGVCMLICGADRKRWYQVPTNEAKGWKTGTFDWKQGKLKFTSQTFGTDKILVLPTLHGKGTAWFDKIELKEIQMSSKGSAIPREWKKVNPKQVFADTEVKLSEKYSIRLENYIQIQKEFSLKPGVQYELTFFLKGKNITTNDKRGVCMLICGADRKRWYQVPTNEAKGWKTGTFDWKQGKLKFTSQLFGTDKILVLPTLNGKGTAWFDKIELKEMQSLSTSSFRKKYNQNVPDAVFYPLGTAGIFETDEAIKFQLEAEGKGNATYRVTLRDFSKNHSDQVRNGKFSLPGKTQIEFPPMETGYYVANAEIFVNGKKSMELQAGAVSAVKQGKRDPFFQIGYGVYPELYNAYKKAGIGTISMKLKVTDHLTPRKNRKIEDVIERLLKYYAPFLSSEDFNVMLSIGTTAFRTSNEKHFAEGRGSLNDAMIENILKGIRLFAERTKGKVHEWAIGSEIPSDATIARYSGTWSEAMYNHMVITRMASRIAKQIDPQIKIYSGGNNIQRYTSTIERVVFGDLVKDVDGYFIDAYTGNWDLRQGNYSIPEQSLQSFYKEASEFAASFGKDPIIKNDESGYSIQYGAEFDRGIAVLQAELTARSIILTKASPVKCYELHRPTSHYHQKLKDMQDSAGCMNTIWKPVLFKHKIYEVPLPGGAMYATAARELAFVKFSNEVISGENYALVFIRPDKKTLVAVWNTASPVEINLPLNETAQMTNMVGRKTLLKKGKNKIKISTAPVYIVTREKPEQITAAIRNSFERIAPDLKCAAKRHDMNTVSLFIRHPGTKNKNADLIINGKKWKTVSLSAGKINIFRIPLCQTVTILSGGKKYIVKPDNSYLKVQRLNTKPVFDGSGKWLNPLQPYHLRYPNDIYPKSALQQELCYFKSTMNPNGHDVSADYYLAYDQENLYLAVKVDDPTHIQIADNGYFWLGDGIQWVISAFDAPPKEVRSDLMKKNEFTSTMNFGLGLAPKGPQYWRYLGKSGRRDYPCNVVRKNNITFYEAALPWTELGIKPASGRAIRFSMVVFDKNSERLKSAPYCLAVTQGVSDGQDAGEYRLLIFEK